MPWHILLPILLLGVLLGVNSMTAKKTKKP